MSKMTPGSCRGPMLRAGLTLAAGVAVSVVGAAPAMAGQCGDPWVTQAVTQVLRRAPASASAPECNIYLYQGARGIKGQWGSYSELLSSVGVYWSMHSYPTSAAPPVARLPTTGPGIGAAQYNALPKQYYNGQLWAWYNSRWVPASALINQDGAGIVSHDGGTFIGHDTGNGAH